jgi:hypothetical protein
MKKEVSTYVYIYYVAFDSFDQYKKSDFYPEYAEKVNGFFFVPLA